MWFEMVAGRSSAAPLRGLFMPKSGGGKANHTFLVKSPRVAASCSGVTGSAHSGAGCSPSTGPGQGWDQESGPTLALV